MRLIVNADDFGYSKGLNYGVIDAFHNGIVSSTTLLTTMPETGEALALIRENSALGLGIHLTVNLGKPFSDPELIPSLAEKNESFRKISYDNIPAINVNEVEREWTLQIDYLLQQGITLTHIDSHHHFHYHPRLLPTACKLATQYKLAMRALPPDYDYSLLSEAEQATYESVKKPEHTLIDFYDQDVSEDYFLSLLNRCPDLKNKTVELMCHPAYLDDIIYSSSSYNTKRVKELQVLKSPAVHQWISDQNIRLINFGHL